MNHDPKHARKGTKKYTRLYSCLARGTGIHRLLYFYDNSRHALIPYYTIYTSRDPLSRTEEGKKKEKRKGQARAIRKYRTRLHVALYVYSRNRLPYTPPLLEAFMIHHIIRPSPYRPSAPPTIRASIHVDDAGVRGVRPGPGFHASRARPTRAGTRGPPRVSAS